MNDSSLSQRLLQSDTVCLNCPTLVIGSSWNMTRQYVVIRCSPKCTLPWGIDPGSGERHLVLKHSISQRSEGSRARVFRFDICSHHAAFLTDTRSGPVDEHVIVPFQSFWHPGSFLTRDGSSFIAPCCLPDGRLVAGMRSTRTDDCRSCVARVYLVLGNL